MFSLTIPKSWQIFSNFFLSSRLTSGSRAVGRVTVIAVPVYLSLRLMRGGAPDGWEMNGPDLIRGLGSSPGDGMHPVLNLVSLGDPSGTMRDFHHLPITKPERLPKGSIRLQGGGGHPRTRSEPPLCLQASFLPPNPKMNVNVKTLYHRAPSLGMVSHH